MSWNNFGERFGPFNPLIAGLTSFFVRSGTTLNYLRQHWFYYRVDGMGFEVPLRSPDEEMYDGNHYELRWFDVDGRGFDVTISGTLNDTGPAAATLAEHIVIENSGDGPLGIAFFSYVKIEVRFGFGEGRDTAILDGDDLVRIDDFGTFEFAFISTPGVSDYRASPIAINVRDVMFNPVINNYDSTGLPLGSPIGDPQDIHMGYQWNRVIETGGQAVFPIGIGINTAAPDLAISCPGDLTGDGAVTTSDLTAFLGAFGTSAGDADFLPGADFNGDDTITTSDLTVFLGNFGCAP